LISEQFFVWKTVCHFVSCSFNSLCV